MKKLIGILFAFIMLISLCVPAFAYETDPETGEAFETITFDFGDIGGLKRSGEGELFGYETNFISFNECTGGDNRYLRLYPKTGNNLIITRVEANVSAHGSSYDGVEVTAGEKREEEKVPNNSIVHIDNINSDKFAFEGGTSHVYFDMLRVYYKCVEHEFGNDGYCGICGKLSCDVAGKHTWNADDQCEVCGIHKCTLSDGHDWDENGICKKCQVLKCEFTGTHDSVRLIKECAYCGEKLSEEIIPAGNNAAGTASGDGNIAVIAGAGCLAVGLGGGFLLGKKKKPAVADGADNTDEEK